MREEIRVAAIDSNLGPAAAEQLEAAGETYTRLLQSDAAAFVKELVNVGSAERRCEICIPLHPTACKRVKRGHEITSQIVLLGSAPPVAPFTTSAGTRLSHVFIYLPNKFERPLGIHATAI